MSDVDVAIVGAGHNALVCGGYLARAGYRVGVVERRTVPGGAAATEELIPGYRVDVGGSIHNMISLTPIVAELDLARFGLEYLEADPLYFAPFPDGSHLLIWRDVARTCASIATISEQDAETYHAFVRDWQPFAAALVETCLHAPSPLNLARYLAWGTVRATRFSPLRLRALAGSYGALLRRTFQSTQVQALVGWLAALSGPPPSAPGSAANALLHPLQHMVGIRTPRGGSGALAVALGRLIEAHGGMVVLGVPAERIVVRNGQAQGVALADGRMLSARAVVAGTHIATTMRLLGEAAPAWARRRVARARTGHGVGVAVRYALAALPDYTALPGTPGAQHAAITLICPDLDYLQRAYMEAQRGWPAREPALTVLTRSAVDATLAPPGRHLMSVWGQYAPYRLAGRQSWEEVGPRVAEAQLAVLARYAPNVREILLDRVVETPTYLERELDLVRGNLTHLDMTPGQMFGRRPAVGLGGYRGPVPGLYLTGASTHPGGGIFGAAGRNAAAVVLRDLARRG